ncbi:MAG: 16S rRNA (adenine(1518)-N(6)/adenine(1519)-N(6))-dimethyltransferase RsmA [Thermoanaerobaculia bacterium]
MRPPYRKALGQHHLRSPAHTAPLIEFLRPAGELVIEIGPGDGALSGPLLAAGARVWAWELDTAWAVRLAARSGSAPALVVGDALDLPFERLPNGTLVAGNLPYNVATPLIDRVLDVVSIARCGFMVQWEVGERLAARPGEPAYGAFSVLVQARARVEILGRVPRGGFRPAPKVDGALVGLTPRPDAPRGGAAEALRETAFEAFANRRKTLRNNLARAWGRPPAEGALAALGLDGGRRAETLSVEELEALAAYRGGIVSGGSIRAVEEDPGRIGP